MSRKRFICFVNKDAQRGTGVLVGASREGGQHRGWRGSDRVDRVRRASSRGGTSNNRRLVTDHASGHISKCIRADGSQGLVQRVGTWKGTEQGCTGMLGSVGGPSGPSTVRECSLPTANARPVPRDPPPTPEPRHCKMANSRDHPRRA